MDDEDVSSRNLEGPFSRHLYIGFAPANKNIVFHLRVKLEKEGVICYLRDLKKEGIPESIQEGVGTSQRCLLFLTSDYLKDDYYEDETLAVVEKSKRFFHDMVIILKSDDLEVIPERLREFTLRQFKPENLNDEKFMAQFVDMITREPNVGLADLTKKITGCESAFNYFYGYLRFVLPDLKARLLKTMKNDPDLYQKTMQKMLIIMPESCKCETKLDSPNQIEFTGKFIVCAAHRAGNQKRDFKNSLYKLIDHERQQEYYFVGEFATPLLTMYDAHSDGLCGMTQDQLYAGRDGFYFALRAILSHPENAECNNQFKLLYWSDPETKKPNQLDLYNCLLQVLRKEILLQRQNEINPSKMETTTNVHLLTPNRPPLKTFERVQFDNPADIYEEVKKYSMNRRPRGLCLIINIANFDQGPIHLMPREGAEKDEELLKKLFKDLHFKVRVEKDISSETLKSRFLDMQRIDHTNYDAFVCCIMTHGKLGVIYTSDGNEVEILQLVDYFTDRKCPSLKGKPKMFFIQACQGGDAEPEHSAAGNSIPHDGSTEDHLALTSSPNTTSDSAANVKSLPLSTRETVECVQVEICSIQSGISNTAGTEIKEDAVADPTASTLDETIPMTSNYKAVLVPGSPDFLMSYSTLPGSVSYRDTQTGSPYIQALDTCLRRDMEIDRALKMVTSNVRENLRQRGELDGIKDRFQLPFHLTSGMEHLIYF